MSGLLTALSRPQVLVSLTVLVALCAVLFRQTQGAIGGPYLDLMSDPEAVRTRLELMTASQKQAHITRTVLLDTAFPLLYTALVLGLLRRYWAGPVFVAGATMILAGAGLDLAENAQQVAMLSGAEGLAGHKAWLTPLKFAAVFGGMGLALAGLVRGIARRGP